MLLSFIETIMLKIKPTLFYNILKKYFHYLSYLVLQKQLQVCLLWNVLQILAVDERMINSNMRDVAKW